MNNKYAQSANEASFCQTLNAFWTLWEEYKPIISKKCYRWLNGNTADVEDALSETAIKAFTCLKKGENDIKNIHSWLYKLAFNVCIDLYRNNKRQLTLVEQVACLPEMLPFASNSSEDLEDFAIRNDNYEQVMQCITRLPENIKSVLVYRFIEGLDYTEIAFRLNIAQPTARKRVQIGRTKLKQLAMV
ncbi:RNA polymerase sigma factor [Endozoicomonas sp. SM1973]|uniref:RNA polymerase sigma factor n=1 Tax=Spartinivicinus marinus TaxID=2994442 RepID=A0A853IF93_9GAMM|nr:RNA polymerase sigma factor [Spartinivicinus marinus]NYZ66166.1 RNA polymerase sigma factor [Spartinivicinus marinus]